MGSALVLALTTSFAAGGGSGVAKLTVEDVRRQGALGNAGLAIEPAPGSDHYEIWRYGGKSQFDTLRVVRAKKGFEERWRVDVTPAQETFLFQRLVASDTDVDGNLVFVSLSASYAYGTGCDARLHKVGQGGDVVYDKKIGHGGCNDVWRLAMLPGGDVLVAGTSGSRGLLRRYSSTGAEELDKDFYKERFDLLATDTGGRIFALMRVSGAPRLRELDSEGSMLWERKFSLGSVVEPRFVDLTVNAQERVVLTAQLQAKGQAGAISVYQYTKSGDIGPNYHNIKTGNSMSWASGDRVFVAHETSGAVILAWTHERDATARVAKVIPQPPSTQPTVSAAAVAKQKYKLMRPKAVAVPPEWTREIAIGRLRGLARVAHGGVVVFGGGQPDGLDPDRVIEAVAVDAKGNLAGSDTLPGASDPGASGAPPDADLAGWYVDGNRVFAIGRAYNAQSPAATSFVERIRYSFGSGSAPTPGASSTTPSSATPKASTPKASTPKASMPKASPAKASSKKGGMKPVKK